MSITTYSELKAAIANHVVYDAIDGSFIWKKSGAGRFKRAGSPAGSLRPDGYVSLCVEGKQWLAHRLAWVLHYGEDPPKIIDHINKNKSDNSIANLRNGGAGVNELNAKVHKRSPFSISGVRKASKLGHYQAYVARRGKFQSLYHGPDFFEACCARKSWDARFWESVK
jgi:hypothetical protein